MSTWAQRIRELQEAGMTLAQIGEQTGLATSTIGDIANGRTASPRGDGALLLHSLHERVVSVSKTPAPSPREQPVAP